MPPWPRLSDGATDMPSVSRLDHLQVRIEKLQANPTEAESEAEVHARFEEFMSRYVTAEDIARERRNAHVVAALAKPSWRGDVVELYEAAIDDLTEKLFGVAGGHSGENALTTRSDISANLALAQNVERAFWDAMARSPEVRALVAKHMATMDDLLSGKPAPLRLAGDSDTPHPNLSEPELTRPLQVALVQPGTEEQPRLRAGKVPIWTPTIR
jgi:hypothetical protein